MSAITTHILDLSRGRPAAGVEVRLEAEREERWEVLGAGTTDPDGRAGSLLDRPLSRGRYRLTVETEPYFAAQGRETFYPRVQVTFEVRDAGQHYHVPLLLSPFGYSTYRGS